MARLLPSRSDTDCPLSPIESSFGKNERRGSALLAGLAYCSVSASMVLLNKYALSSFNFHSPNVLLLVQCLFSVVVVKGAEGLGVWKVEALRWDIIKLWLPVNVIFILMLSSGILALQNMGVGMVTIIKNLTNLLTITGDYLLYGRTYNACVWASLLLISASALVGASSDREFSWLGYYAQILNCVFTAGYSLLLKGVMEKVTVLLDKKMDTQSEVYYNNLLSLPFVFILMFMTREHDQLFVDPAVRFPLFQLVVACSCVAGFSISYAALWFLSTTTPTTYSLVGSLNKIPIAVIGILAFRSPTSPTNLFSIGVGLLAGVLFVLAKQAGVNREG